MNHQRISALGILLLALGACGEQPEQETAELGGEVTITWEEFLASAEREPWEDGKFIVDGDIALPDEDALFAYYNSFVRSEGALTVSQIFGADEIWGHPDAYKLTYCVSDSFGSQKALVVETMARATGSWEDVVGVDYEYVPSQDGNCTASNNNVLFDVRPANASYFARAFFPSEGRSTRNVLITQSAFTTNSGGRDFEGILRHELGHSLGFRHEHIWLRDPCTTEGNENARQVTSYDANSVMHYPQCRPSEGGGYRQTALDYEGAMSLYGLAPRQIMSSISSLL